MDLKKLREKRNALIEQGNDLFGKAEEETRGLTEDEATSLEEVRSEVEKIDATIEKEKEFRSSSALADDSEIENREAGENMSELETRAMDTWLRGNVDEYRDIVGNMTAGNQVENTAGNGGITIPTSVFNQIIEKLGQEAPVFSLSHQYPSLTGRLKIARETADSDDEGFVGEGVNVTPASSKLRSIVLDQKRVGASFQLTNELISDAGFNVVDYATQRVAKKVSRTITRNILVGAKSGGPDSFRPVVGTADIKVNDLEASITVENLIDMYSALHQGYQAGAVWVMAKSVFDQIAKLKDGDGRYLIFQNLVDGNPEYTLFGGKVYVDDVMESAPDNQKVIFGNFGVGYATLVKQGMNLTHVTQDTQQALAGGHLVVLDAMLDGEVQNPDAFIIGKQVSK